MNLITMEIASNTQPGDERRVPEKQSELPAVSLLPGFTDNGAADLWLTRSDLRAVQRLRSAKPAGLQSIGLLIVWYGVICCNQLAGLLMSLWLSAGFAVPMVLSLLAIGKMNEGNVNGALRLCELARKLEPWLGPVGVIFSSVFLDQVRAVALSMNGQLVESQVILAQRLDARNDVLSEPAIQTTFGSIYANTGNLDKAEEIYTKRYQTARSSFTEPLSKGIASSNMGWIHLLKGNNEVSLQYSREAMAIIRKQDFRLMGCSLISPDWDWLKSNTLTNAARACIRLNDFEEAERLLDEALALVVRLSKHCGANSEVQLGFAELRLQQGRLTEAHLYAQSAIECYRGSVGPAFYSFVYARKVLAKILQLLDREKESQELLLQAEIEEHTVIEDNENLLLKMRKKILPGNLIRIQ